MNWGILGEDGLEHFFWIDRRREEGSEEVDAVRRRLDGPTFTNQSISSL